MMRLPKVSRAYFTLNLKLHIIIFQSFGVNLSWGEESSLKIRLFSVWFDGYESNFVNMTPDLTLHRPVVPSPYPMLLWTKSCIGHQWSKIWNISHILGVNDPHIWHLWGKIINTFDFVLFLMLLWKMSTTLWLFVWKASLTILTRNL